MCASAVSKRSGKNHKVKVFAVGFKPRMAGLVRPQPSGYAKRVPSKKRPIQKTRPSRNFRELSYGSIPNYAPICQDRNDSDTVDRCVTKRLDAPLPVMSRSVRDKLRDFVRKWVRAYLRPVVKMSEEEYLASTNYNEKRKEQLREASRKNKGQPPPQWILDKIGSFLKLEVFDELKEARGINPRADQFKIWASPFVKAMESEVYRLHQFIKHVPVPDRPALIAALEKQGYYYYENDFKMFEGSIRKEVMSCIELEVLSYLLSNYPGDARILAQADIGVKKLRFRACLFSWIIEAVRCSGDPWTSLFNGLTNLLTVSFIVAQKLDGSLGAAARLDGFVEGDDGIFASPVPLTEADFATLGFRVEIQQLQSPRDGHFCGNRMSRDLTLLKDPRRVFRSFGWTGSYLYAGTAIMDSLLRSKALSLCYEMPQCPVVGQLARRALELTSGVRITHEVDSYHARPADFTGPTGEFCPSPCARLEFETRFGVSVATQLKCEEAIRHDRLDIVSVLIPPTREDIWYSSRHLEYD